MSLREAMRTVRGLRTMRAPFEHIEAWIEDAPGLDEDERAILWLYAWAEAELPEVVRFLKAGAVSHQIAGSLPAPARVVP